MHKESGIRLTWKNGGFCIFVCWEGSFSIIGSWCRPFKKCVYISYYESFKPFNAEMTLNYENAIRREITGAICH